MAELNRARPFLKLAALILLLGGALVVVRLTPLREYLTLERAVAGLNALRSSTWAPIVFVAGYATATAFALPGSALTIAGGAVFGFWGGALLNTIGANIGANAAFGIARVLGKEGVERIAGSRLQGLQRATTEHGFLGLLILRLVPLVPFNALNFGSGMTALRWRDYTLATLIGIFPGTLVYTFFADALVLGSTQASHDARIRLWIAAGLLVALSLIPVIAKRLGFRLHSDTSPETTT